jgi:hypothetical protein
MPISDPVVLSQPFVKTSGYIGGSGHPLVQEYEPIVSFIQPVTSQIDIMSSKKVLLTPAANAFFDTRCLSLRQECL